ncbi:MAG: hypothetical protein QOD75_540, partial [Blastocatellia bacterium]|nr:hypothetical protein [Blastocatellia bacterium]
MKNFRSPVRPSRVNRLLKITPLRAALVLAFVALLSSI